MSIFARKINLSHLDQLGRSEPSWLDDLFRFWAPAGSGARPGAAAPLRLAIRENYVNFYADGQSIANVRMGSDTLSARVHEKYFEPNAETRRQIGQKYRRLECKGTDNRPTDVVSSWMQVASSYAGAEKTFVERLVAANPNVIDLEMALPAFPGEKSAARVDLVALEPSGRGWRLVFWEAKMAKNPEARAKGDTTPKVVAQKDKYCLWLGANEDLVLSAYHQVCRDLVDIHRRVSQSPLGVAMPELGEGIRQVADGKSLILDNKIRLVIGGWDPNGSFEKNGHHKKLVSHMTVQVVAEKNGDHWLRGEGV